MVRITKKDEKKEEEVKKKKKRQTVCLFSYCNSEMFHSQTVV
jgi:hypothetical protein